MSRKGHIYVHDKFAGILEETDEGTYKFIYDDEYLKVDGAPVSLTLPTHKKIHESSILFPFFDGLLPEGWQLSLSSKNWKIAPRDRMGLLLEVCLDCIGNVSVRKA